jgi:hypothetical protein
LLYCFAIRQVLRFQLHGRILLRVETYQNSTTEA